MKSANKIQGWPFTAIFLNYIVQKLLLTIKYHKNTFNYNPIVLVRVNVIQYIYVILSLLKSFKLISLHT